MQAVPAPIQGWAVAMRQQGQVAAAAALDPITRAQRRERVASVRVRLQPVWSAPPKVFALPRRGCQPNGLCTTLLLLQVRNMFEAVMNHRPADEDVQSLAFIEAAAHTIVSFVHRDKAQLMRDYEFCFPRVEAHPPLLPGQVRRGEERSARAWMRRAWMQAAFPAENMSSCRLSGRAFADRQLH